MALSVSLDEIIAGGNGLLAIKAHWRRVRLGDIGEVLNGFAFKAELFTREGGMPLIRIRDVGSSASETFYSGDFDERYVVSAGELLVGMDGDFNCARWRGPRSLLNQRVCKITVDESLYLPRFLDYVLPGYLKAINDATSSVTVKHLSSRTIQDIPLPLPPMDEQREIVAELEKQFSRLDEAVANLQRVKANLKRYKASVLKAAVEGRFATPDESRSSPSSSGSRSELLDIARTGSIGKIRRGVPESVPLSEAAQTIKVPSGWCLRSVAELLRVGAIVDLKDGNHGTNHPRTSDFVNKGLPFLTASEVVDFHIDYDGAYPLAKLKVGFAETGDVILTHKGTVGRVAICDRSCVLSPQTTYYRLNTSHFLAHYFQYFLASHSFTIQLNAIKSQTTRDYVPISEQYRLFIVCPPLGEQARIVAEVDRHLSIIREVEAEVDANLQRAQALRQATLRSAFNPAEGV